MSAGGATHDLSSIMAGLLKPYRRQDGDDHPVRSA